LAIPRRVYTNSQMQYVAENIIELYEDRENIRGYEIEYQAKVLRHFTARLKPLV
jgi:tryptophanase